MPRSSVRRYGISLASKLYAAPEGIRKTPTIAFRVEGLFNGRGLRRMLGHGFFVAAGDFYASTLAGEKLGIKDSGRVRPRRPRPVNT